MTDILLHSPQHRRRSLTHNATILPCLPESAGATERGIYMSFIRALRESPHRRMEVRVLTAIHKAADQTDNSDAYVSRVLVDMGLMAPRLSFPGDFLDHVDATLLRDRPLASVPASYQALTQHWGALGEQAWSLNVAASRAGLLHSFLVSA